MSENYFLSLIDIWILSNTLKLPIIVISAGKITYTGEKYFVMNNNIENTYFILKITISTEKKLYPEYRLIVDSKGSKNIKIGILKAYLPTKKKITAKRTEAIIIIYLILFLNKRPKKIAKEKELEACAEKNPYFPPQFSFTSLKESDID